MHRGNGESFIPNSLSLGGSNGISGMTQCQGEVTPSCLLLSGNNSMLCAIRHNS